MIVPKKNRTLTYMYLFKEGTIVVKQDSYQEKHSDELSIPNLEVMTMMKSFRSKGFVKSTYNWRYNYYTLTPEGIDYLRQYLAIPADVVPATLRPTIGAARTDDRQKDKSAGPGADFNPEFQKSKASKEGYRS